MLRLTQTKRHGLEVFRVWHGETLVCEHLSYALAWTAFKRLKAKLITK